MGKGARRGAAMGRRGGENVAAAARPEQRLLPVVELLVQAGVALRELVIATGTQVLSEATRGHGSEDSEPERDSKHHRSQDPEPSRGS